MSRRFTALLAVLAVTGLFAVARADEVTVVGGLADAPVQPAAPKSVLRPLILAFKAPPASLSAELVRVRYRTFQFSGVTGSYTDLGDGLRLYSVGADTVGARFELGSDADEAGVVLYPFSLMTRRAAYGQDYVGYGFSKAYLRRAYRQTFVEVGAQMPLLWSTSGGVYSGPVPVRGYIGSGLEW